MVQCIQRIKCGRDLPDAKAKYCVHCGAPQEVDCPNPQCDQVIRLSTVQETGQCPNQHCQRFLRYCPCCYKLFLLGQELCDNTDWNCAGTPLVDFFHGYQMIGVNAQRTTSFIETIVHLEDRDFPKRPDDFDVLWSYREPATSISDIVAGYGSVFFVSASESRVRRISERSTGQGMGPLGREVVSSASLEFPPSSQVRDLTVSNGLITFLAGPEPEYTTELLPRYFVSKAFCLEADTLSNRLPIRYGLYQTQLLTNDLWLLARYDQQLQCSWIEVYRQNDGTQAASLQLPKGVVINERVPAVVVEQMVFFATTEGALYKIVLNQAEMEAQEVDWFDGGKTRLVQAMSYGEGCLRVLACDQENWQNYHLFALKPHGNGGLQRSLVHLEGMPRRQLWILNHFLFVYESSQHVLQGYDLQQEGFYPGPSRRFHRGDNVQRLLPTQVDGRRFVMAQIERQDGLTYFRLHDLDSTTAELTFAAEDWRDAGFVYANGRAFIYSKAKSTIKAIKTFIPKP